MVIVNCPNCGQDFKAYAQMSEQSFKELEHVINIERCPHCNQLVRYTKNSMRYGTINLKKQFDINDPSSY
ncbi:hypothetical protein [Halalkalibacter oceani]|uniref:hypothetical protein n=1 Tax=Halalkalibacter oceani TaxID=1653776 RepID=UPI003391EC18